MIPEDDELRQDETSSGSEPAPPGSDSTPPGSAAEDAPESASGSEQATPDMGQESDENPDATVDSTAEAAPPPGDSSPNDSPAADSDAASAADRSPPSAASDQSQVSDLGRGSVSSDVPRGGPQESGELTQANDSPPASPETSPAAGSQPSAGTPADNPRLNRTADSGPPLARPIVLVSLSTKELHDVVEAALKLAIDRDTATLNQIAEAKVNSAFTQYKTQQRILAR